MTTSLLQKYISGNATDRERQQITEWIQRDEENLREYMAQRKLFDISLWNAEAVSAQKKHFFLDRTVIRMMKFAAIIVLALWGIVSGVSGWMNKNIEQLQCVYSPPGQRSEISLSDGTKVWLNARSRLTFPSVFKGKNRKVKLDGEGYFIVSKNKEKPFIVETCKYDVKVLGTEFNVMAYSTDEMWATSLLRGCVEIYSTRTGERMKLTPNKMAIYKHHGLIRKQIEDKQYFRWRDGLLYFNNVSIREMLDKLKLYYGVNIVVNNTKILSNRYTGKFWVSDGIEHVFKVLRLDNNFIYMKDDDKNLITIN